MNTKTLDKDILKDGTNYFLEDNDSIINTGDSDISKINDNLETELNIQKENSLHIKYLNSGYLNPLFSLSALIFSLFFILVPFWSFMYINYHESEIASFIIGILSAFSFVILLLVLTSNRIWKKKKTPESYHNLDVKYLLPLSSEDLAIFIDNDEYLKEYIVKNNDVIYSQYTLDEIMNVNSEYRSMFDELNLSFDSLLKDDSNYSKFKINKIIKDEQNKIRNIKTENKLNTYKVHYSIENGPTKFKVFKSNREDRDLFKQYIASIVNNEYKRNFLIKDIEKLN